LGYIAILYLGDFSIAKYSARIFNEYCAYCEKVQKWLADNNYKTKEDYEELIALLSGLLEREKNEKQQKEQRADKWLQTLVIPVVLAIIVAAISKANELHNMIAITMGILTFFFAIYIMISIIRTIIALPQKRRDVQIQNLIDDINGVITLNKE
jgi:hypothetical protein